MWRRDTAGPGSAFALLAIGIATALSCAASGPAPRGGAPRPERPAPSLPAGSDLTRDLRTGTVRFLKGQNLSRDLDGDPAFMASRSAGDAEGVARAFLVHFAELWSLDDPDAELALRRVDVDRSGASHVRFDQVWQGLPVPGAQLTVHLDRDRRVVLVNGSYFETPRRLDPTPRLDADAARSAAARELGGAPCAVCATDLVVFAERETAPRLAWRVAAEPSQIRGEEILVDARDGSILRRVPSSQSGASGSSSRDAR